MKAAAFINFRTLKAQLSIEAVLSSYQIILRRFGETLRGPCPLPTHTSQKSRYSFSVNTSKGVWSCHSLSCISARGGKVGGDVLDLVALLERCSIREAGLRLETRFVTPAGPATTSTPSCRSTGPAALSRLDTRAPVRPNRPLGFRLQGIDPTHPYLHGRGIELETARHFGIGMYCGGGLFRGRIVIPLHNEVGKLVAYGGRSIDGSEPRYRFPAGFRKSEVLFNLHRVSGTSVVVVEGFFDCLKVRQAGFHNVVALMGCSLSAQQELLLSMFGRITLFLDGDDAGVRAAKSIGDRLSRSHVVQVVEIDPGRQPDELSSEAIRALLSP
jgi:hypothetical protein